MKPENPVKRTDITNPVNWDIFIKKLLLSIFISYYKLMWFQAHHIYNDVGKFYTLPPPDIKHYFQLGGIPKQFSELSQAFNETCIMVRKPFLEVRDYLAQANYSNLPMKFVLCILFSIYYRHVKMASNLFTDLYFPEHIFRWPSWWRKNVVIASLIALCSLAGICIIPCALWLIIILINVDKKLIVWILLIDIIL